jgi:AcrR family transcriptional regulator
VRSSDRQNKRDQIMMAAEQLFTNRRFHEITLDQVARAAGVGKGTIYLHFADKDDLFFQVATSGFTQLCEIVERGAATGGPFHENLVAVCRQISAFFQRRRQLLRMMQTEDGRMAAEHGAMRERWLTHRRPLVAALGKILAAGVREGVVRQDVPPEALASFLLGMLRTRARELEASDAVSLDLVVGLFLFGAVAGAVMSARPAAEEGKQS